MDKITIYLKEVKSEMSYVTWPSKSQTVFFTIGVLVISVIVAYYLGALDSVFTKGLEWLLNR